MRESLASYIKSSEVDKHLYTNVSTENGDLMAVGKQAAAKLTPKEYEGVERLVKAGYFLNVSDFVRSAVREKLEAMKLATVRRLSPAAAEREVHRYIKAHPGAYPDEIADALNLDLETIMDAVGALMARGKVGELG